ncbi:S8 family serine peptidase [Cnuibacter physcomitrellae]|uniref:S8 family serine peptidase n=1 Tax=Cnuibacter physcomitrellae TaxID=1619308 RepID=UPI00217618AD|nr:S8 family serine peptidase [Cnuibacter physcomitrellae]MCS5497062.1 S8 family serine peptidase [Cnuibacter physcomitrellae]
MRSPLLSTALVLVAACAVALGGAVVGLSEPAAAAATDCRSVPVEADGPLRSAEARAAFGVDGSGITVGLMSDSFDVSRGVTSWQDDVAAGVLPGPGNPCGDEQPVEVLREGAGGGADEGRAMAQLVHGIAPGARLVFATDGGNVDTAADAVRALAAAGADIIVDDVSPTGELIYQKTALSLAIEQVRSEGVLYLTSAGNENIVGAAGTPAEGRPISGWSTPSYRPTACPAWVTLDDTVVDCLDFDPSGTSPDPTYGLELGEGQSPKELIQWGEPQDGAKTRLVLQLYSLESDTPELLATSRPLAEGPGVTAATLATLPDPVDEGEYAFVVVRAAADPESLPAVTVAPELAGASVLAVEYDRSAGSDRVGVTTYGHQSDGSVSATIGAAGWSTPDQLRDYSSLGPGTLLFGPTREDEQPASRLSEPVVVHAPQMIAVDGTRTSFFGSRSVVDGEVQYRFSGTSAAAPNAAAVLALGWSLRPDARADDVLAAAQRTATPLVNPYAEFGFADEDVVGSGLVDASALLADLAVAPAPTPSPSAAGAASAAALAATGAPAPWPLLAAASAALAAGAGAFGVRRRMSRRAARG